MQRYKFSELTFDLVKRIVNVREELGAVNWQPASLPLSEQHAGIVSFRKQLLQKKPVRRLNEATVWSKAIYPLLELVERDSFAAWAQVELRGEFLNFTLEGIVDGVIGTERISSLSAPYLVVMEAKKEVEAKDPQPQLYGAMLAAAKLNWDEKKVEPQTIYGCYTIGDSWTFLRGKVEQIETERPTFYIEASRDFIERFEAETILGILKAIVAENEQQ